MKQRIVFSATRDEILNGETSDIYFHRTEEILKATKTPTDVTIEIFSKGFGYLCGITESLNLLSTIKPMPKVWAKPEGEKFSPKEVVMRIQGDYRTFGIYETAILGILASSSGWTTAAKFCMIETLITTMKTLPSVLSFGARHIHPAIAPVMDRAALVGGVQGCSTPLGASYGGIKPSGTMPHALILILGDTVLAAEKFNEIIDKDVKRIVLVDTFKDEVEESLRVAEDLGEDLYGVRLDTPQERGGVTVQLVKELRAKLDLKGHNKVKIFVSGGITPTRIRDFMLAGAIVDGFGVGSYISGAKPIDFTADIKEINGELVAKRGRIPGLSKDKLERMLI